MSEEIAASIGDVLAKNARLKVYLAQVTERALAAEAELARERDGATMAGVLRAMISELNTATQDAEAWRQAVQRLERRCERTNAINRVLNAQVLGWFARASAIEHTARRLVAAWRTQRQYRYALADALQGLLDEPYGCPLCDAGRMLNPAKGHWPECPYEIARVVLAELREA